MSEIFVFECVYCDEVVASFYPCNESAPAVCKVCSDFDEAYELANLYEANAYDLMADR